MPNSNAEARSLSFRNFFTALTGPQPLRAFSKATSSLDRGPGFRDVVLWESMAINLYLAQEYKGPMHCAGPEALGLAAQWSFWAMLEMEHLLLDLLTHRALLPESVRDPSYAERDELLLQKPRMLATLRSATEKLPPLRNSRPVNAALSTLSVWGKMARLGLSSHPEVKGWLDKCLARPAYGRVRDWKSSK